MTHRCVVGADQFNYSSLVKFVFRYVPFAMRLYRWFLYLKHEVGFGLFRNHQSRISRRVRSQLEGSIVQRLKKVGRLDLVPALTPGTSYAAFSISVLRHSFLSYTHTYQNTHLGANALPRARPL